MSGSSRSTQGQGHGTVGGAQHARTLALVASGVPYAAALDAPRVEAGSQDEAKPEHFYGSCNGPTGPCLLGIGHEGPHIRPHSPFGGVVSGVRELRAERDKALRLLGTAGKLLRSIQSYGNPGHSFRQDICDQIDALLKEAK